MATKFFAIALAVFVFGSVARSNAGTEVIPGYSAPAPTYNYAPPPPRPVYYPPPPVNVLVFPAYGYYGPRFGVHRFYGRHVFLRPHHQWR
ncbi:MAG TPA: hypothetical protein VGH08_11090 [Chthoniobacterales bacterium]